MSVRQSTASRPVFSASNARDVIAKVLTEIKDAQGLTDADLGRILGKSDDQAAKYRTGLAGMDAFSLMAAWREWNGEFIGPIRRFCEDSRPQLVDDQQTLTTILEAGLKISVALEDGSITPEEVRANRPTLENLRDVIDAQLGKLRPAA